MSVAHRWAGTASVVLVACAGRAQDCLSWREVDVPGGVPSARRDFGFAFDAHRGVAVVFGGAPGSGPALGDTWEWGGTDWRLAATGGPSPRLACSLTYDPGSQRCLLFGGELSSGGPTDEIWAWDGVSWTPVAAAPGPSPRARHAAAFDTRRGVLLIHGGWTGTTRATDTWAFDGAVWRRRSTTGPEGSGTLAMAWDPARGVAVLHRSFNNNIAGPWDTFEWDGTAWWHRATGSAPQSAARELAFDSARARVVRVDEDGRVWEWSGSQWGLRGEGAFPWRSGGGLVFDPARGEVLLLRGLRGTPPPLYADLWAWDGSVWRERSTGLSPRAGAAMCFDAARAVAVMVGGSGDDSTPNNETWEWDGAAWSLRRVPPPTVAVEHTLTYDSRRGVCVLFGAESERGARPVYSELWEFDGAAWRRGPDGPPRRHNHAAAYDPIRGQTVIFGGLGRSTAFGDTWTWDGAAWREHAVPGPSARYHASMAFDRARGVVVLFGGVDDTPLAVPHQDTWEWDGTRWEFRDDAGPNVFDTVLYYDERHARVRLLGPPLHQSQFLETWEWDGEAWRPVSLAGPPTRRGPAACYDATREGVVMFGGGGFWRMGDSHVSFASTLAFRAIPQGRRIDVGETLELNADACGDNPSFQWRRDGQALIDDGRITGSRTPSLRIDDFRPSDAGLYDVVATTPAGSIASRPGALIELYTSPECYADCDTSTGRRVLDVFDFLCFLNDFAAGGSYACDCDQGQWYCEVFDFLCFLNRFDAGCP